MGTWGWQGENLGLGVKDGRERRGWAEGREAPTESLFRLSCKAFTCNPSAAARRRLPGIHTRPGVPHCRPCSGRSVDSRASFLPLRGLPAPARAGCGPKARAGLGPPALVADSGTAPARKSAGGCLASRPSGSARTGCSWSQNRRAILQSLSGPELPPPPRRRGPLLAPLHPAPLSTAPGARETRCPEDAGDQAGLGLATARPLRPGLQQRLRRRPRPARDVRSIFEQPQDPASRRSRRGPASWNWRCGAAAAGATCAGERWRRALLR